MAGAPTPVLRVACLPNLHLLSILYFIIHLYTERWVIVRGEHCTLINITCR